MSNRKLDKIFDIIELLPLMPVAVLASFGTVSMALLLGDSLSNVLVITLGGIATLISLWLVWGLRSKIDRPGSQIEIRIVDTVVLGFVLFWVGFNFSYASQHVFTDRDPGIYVNAAAWVVDNESLRIDIEGEYSTIHSLYDASSGFSYEKPDTTHLHAQGNHLLPVLVGLGGRVVDSTQMLKLNLLIGGAAILAVYAVARSYTRPYWALFPTIAFGFSMPLIYFSRDMYTEPLTAMFAFGGLAFLAILQKNKRPLYPLWFLTGLIFGASVMARIDGYLIIIAPIIFSFAYLTNKRSNKKLSSQDYTKIGLLAIGVLIASLIGYVDVTQLSSAYYRDVSSKVAQEVKLILALIGLGVVLFAIDWRKGHPKKLVSLIVKHGPKLVAYAGSAFFLYVVSRPFWQVAYEPTIIRNELRELVPSDTLIRRNYAELSATWSMWYLGPMVAFSGFIGYVILAAKSLKKIDPTTLALLSVSGVSILLYFFDPNIFPDQIWASRRQLSVIFPALVVLAGVALNGLHLLVLNKLSDVAKSVAIVFVSLVVFVPPLLTSSPLVFHKDTHRLGSVKAVCELLPDDAVILLVGTARGELNMPIRNYCGIIPIGVGSQIPVTNKMLTDLAQKAAQDGHKPYVGVYQNQQPEFADLPSFISPEESAFPISISFSALEKNNIAPPRDTVQSNNILLISSVDEQGRLSYPQ